MTDQPEIAPLREGLNPWRNSSHAPVPVHTTVTYWSVCCACGLKGPNAPTEAEARAAWNHRPREDALRDALEKLQADAIKLGDSEVVANCEGCGTWLLEGDDFVSSDDCSGCWATMTDLPSKRERPCYAYRVGKGPATQLRNNLNSLTHDRDESPATLRSHSQ